MKSVKRIEIIGHAQDLSAITGILDQLGLTTYAINPDYAEEQAFGFIPIIGPFLLLDYINDDTGLGVTFLILSGVAQAAGITLMILGLVTTREVQVRASLGDQPDSPTLTFTPLVSNEFAGGALTLTHF